MLVDTSIAVWGERDRPGRGHCRGGSVADQGRGDRLDRAGRSIENGVGAGDEQPVKNDLQSAVGIQTGGASTQRPGDGAGCHPSYLYRQAGVDRPADDAGPKQLAVSRRLAARHGSGTGP